jgi:hypothetical protein
VQQSRQVGEGNAADVGRREITMQSIGYKIQATLPVVPVAGLTAASMIAPAGVAVPGVLAAILILPGVCPAPWSRRCAAWRRA